jgi:alpha-L-arabinofuranosidase
MDGAKIFVKLSNADLKRSVATHIELSGFAHQSSVRVILPASTDPARRNTFLNPAAVVPVQQTIRCASSCTFILPADSVAVLTFVKMGVQP